MKTIYGLQKITSQVKQQTKVRQVKNKHKKESSMENSNCNTYGE
jgi:hypothetical protein